MNQCKKMKMTCLWTGSLQLIKESRHTEQLERLAHMTYIYINIQSYRIGAKGLFGFSES